MSLWQHPGRKIILASGSPRRKELLAVMGFVFDVIPAAAIDEVSYLKNADLSGSIQRLAIAKAENIDRNHEAAIVLAADTIVVSDTQVLGKPADRREAKQMLETLSGCSHTVLTGVALTCREIGFCRSTTASTTVHFREITSDEIDWYLDSGESFDKAGAYGIQGKAMIFVDAIEGCFYNVVGLPVKSTIDLFKAFTA